MESNPNQHQHDEAPQAWETHPAMSGQPWVAREEAPLAVSAQLPEVPENLMTEDKADALLDRETAEALKRNWNPPRHQSHGERGRSRDLDGAGDETIRGA